MMIAHKREDGTVQSLWTHLEAVAALAGDFGTTFGAGEHARRAGLLHDIGKYSPAGQRRMNDPKNAPKVDHSSAGAQEALKLNDPLAAFAIAGHHAGLPNRGGRASTPDDGTLMGRSKKRLTGPLDYSAWRGEINVGRDVRALTPPWLDPRDSFGAQFYTRMLFSCLVDADFLDTERFLRGEVERDEGESVDVLLNKLNAYVADRFSGKTGALNECRNHILQQCVAGAAQQPGLFTLSVPTGGGKTTASLAFALNHAAQHGLRRVIYVIPYTSIIEQNAQVFCDMLGAENVLEHHSNVDYEKNSKGEPQDDDELMQRRKLATENWDAPVIVTTAVQFFESLFSAKVSRCRKLHNIAESAVIFDEAQLIPANYLIPCVAAIAELAKHYRVSAVLCTATQPALDEFLGKYAPDMPIRELCPAADAMAETFRRVRFVRDGKLGNEELAQRLSQCDQVLCVVNTRARAQALWELLPQEGRFHLTTLMTATHRSAVLKEIRRRLAAGEPCRVVSTSLIEAGVDVDFPTVWRELCGLDSVLQAAGRCNREGRRPVEDSVVHIFTAEGGVPKMIQQNVDVTGMILDTHAQPDAPDAVRDYFRLLHRLMGNSTDYRNIMDACREARFRDVSDKFHLIDDFTRPVYIPSEGNKPLLDALRSGELSRALMRKLGRSTVNLYPRDIQSLFDAGALELTADGFFILSDQSLYDVERGLVTHVESGNALFV